MTLQNKGFTLIELLLILAIIALLSSIILSGLNNARKKARDSKRLSDMKQIQVALEMYYHNNGIYPGNTDNDCGGWDSGKYGEGDNFIQPLVDGGYMRSVPGDPVFSTSCGAYRYYRYSGGSYGCAPTRGAFYVLGAVDIETSARPHSSSPGFSCSGRNWGSEMDWVIGKFENG